MVLVQININKTLDKELKHYMVDNNHIVKSKAIVEIVEKHFTKDTNNTNNKENK